MEFIHSNSNNIHINNDSDNSSSSSNHDDVSVYNMIDESRMESESPSQTDEEEADLNDFPHEQIKTWDNARRYFDLSRSYSEDTSFTDSNNTRNSSRNSSDS